MMQTTKQGDEVHADIWQEQAQLAQRLLRWGALNVGAGIALTLQPAGWWRGFGAQAAGWGAVNAGIGLFGLRGARTKADQPQNHTSSAQREARRSLRRILLINSALDAGYIAGGLALARTKGRESAVWRGSGWSVVVQGSFLLLFDLIHALMLT
jgi:hypothetical protein